MFTPWPKTPDGKLDKKRIREEYYAADQLGWRDYCAVKNYGHTNDLPHKSWENHKRETKLWADIRGDVETKSTRLEADTLRRALKALDTVPEALQRLWDLLQYQVLCDTEDMAHDMKLRKMAAQEGRIVSEHQLKFKRKASYFFAMSAAAKNISETLYKSLGVEVQLGSDLKGRIDNKLEQLDQGEKFDRINVVLMGGGDVDERIKNAVAKYLDPPRLPEPKPDAESET